MSCRSIVPFLEPFSDGELEPETILEVEQHLSECSLCVERLRLGKAVRSSVKRVVRENAEPSDAFRKRLAAALDAAHQREWETRVLTSQHKNHMLSWRTILPTAAAAAAILVWAGSGKDVPSAQRGKTSEPSAPMAASIDQMLDELVTHHVRNRPEVTEPTLVPEFEREVGVPLKIPNLSRYGARWESGSVVPVQADRRAASLRYKLAGHRVTLYVYKSSSRDKIERALAKRRVGDEQVYVGSYRGYSIGATERSGVGYALASDLNDAETAELVAAIY